MIFFSAALAHLLAVMSPGPDTAIIFHQSFAKGRAQGILTALGIGFGIFIHCLFAISGITLLIYSSEEAKFFIKCGDAAPSKCKCNSSFFTFSGFINTYLLPF